MCPALPPNIQLYYFCSSVFEKSNTHKAQTCNGHILKLHCSLLATEAMDKRLRFHGVVVTSSSITVPLSKTIKIKSFPVGTAGAVHAIFSSV